MSIFQVKIQKSMKIKKIIYYSSLAVMICAMPNTANTLGLIITIVRESMKYIREIVG